VIEMGFKKKFESYYMAKLWKHYETIPQSEVNVIIKSYGKKPMAKEYYEQLERIIYDETSEKIRPETCGHYEGFWQIAIYQDTLIVRRVAKHINRCSKHDLLSFKSRVEKIFRIKKNGSYLVSDLRFRRMRLNAKDFKIFRKEEHNKLHRVLSSLQIKHYNGREYTRQLWKEISISHRLDIKFLRNI